MLTLIYPKIEDIIEKHDEIIKISGGLNGVKNIGYLESPLSFVQENDYYPKFENKLTHLVFSINKNHAFEDGNKRTSIAIGAMFLEFNGFGYIVGKFIREMENISVLVADNFIDKSLLNEIIYSIIFEDDYSEELKLKIISVMTVFEERKNDTYDDDFF